MAASWVSGGCGESSPPPSSSAPAAARSAATTSIAAGTADACALLTAAKIAEVVGNPVKPGQPNAGPEVCKWRTEQSSETDVLLTVRLKDSLREKVLCGDVRKAAAAGSGTGGIGEAARWVFSRTGTLFNSGELEVCDAKGYVNVSLNGQLDEATLKAAAMKLAREVLSRL